MTKAQEVSYRLTRTLKNPLVSPERVTVSSRRVPVASRSFPAGVKLSGSSESDLKKPEKISLLDIVEIVQGPVEILDCLDSGMDCGRKRNCFARRIWSKANAGIRKCLNEITLADAF